MSFMHWVITIDLILFGILLLKMLFGGGVPK